MSWFYKFFKKKENGTAVRLQTANCLQLGSTGTVGIGWVATTVDPIGTGVTVDLDIGSILVGGTAGLYVRTGYTTTSWASVDRYD